MALEKGERRVCGCGVKRKNQNQTCGTGAREHVTRRRYMNSLLDPNQTHDPTDVFHELLKKLDRFSIVSLSKTKNNTSLSKNTWINIF